MQRIPRRVALFFLLIVSSWIAMAPLRAQEQPYTAFMSPPADRIVVSPGGVDMRTGRYMFSQTDLSIGGESGGLALTRQAATGVLAHVEPLANFSHNFDIMLTEARVDMVKMNFDPGAGQDYRISVHYAGRADTFQARSNVAALAQVSQRENVDLTFSGNPADRNGPVVYTYQAPDGTTVVFRPLGYDCDTGQRCAYASQINYPDGTRLDLTYDDAGTANTARLRRVVNSRGFALLLDYGAAGGGWHHVGRACVINLALSPLPAFVSGSNACPTNPLASSSYTYTSSAGGGLASATDAAGGTWTYGYTQHTGYTDMSFTRPGESTPWLVNSIGGHEGSRYSVVFSQAFADGQSYTYEYADLADRTAGYVHQLAGGSYFHRDPDTVGPGRETVVRYGFHRLPESMRPHNPNPYTELPEIFAESFYRYFQVTPGPIEVTDPLGRTTRYDYCDPVGRPVPAPPPGQGDCLVTDLQYFIDPEEIRTELAYDLNKHPALIHRVAAPQPNQQPLDTIVTSASYDCTSSKTCAEPSQIIDANGNVTDRAYSPVHGGLLSATGPAVPTPQPNGSVANVRPQTRYEYAQRQARLSDGAPAGPPIWLLVRERFCRTTAAAGPSCAGGASDEVITDYDYGSDSGPNNLLLHGKTVTSIDNGVTTVLRTCYGNDAFGRRISETQPNANANLAACP